MSNTHAATQYTHFGASWFLERPSSQLPVSRSPVRTAFAGSLGLEATRRERASARGGTRVAVHIGLLRSFLILSSDLLRSPLLRPLPTSSDLLRSPPISSDLLSSDLFRSLPISSDLLRSPPISSPPTSSDLFRPLPTSSDLFRSLPISSDLLRPPPTSSDLL